MNTLENDPVVRALRERLNHTESRIDEIYEVIMGNPRWQTVGIRHELNRVRQDREDDRKLLDGLIQEKARERSEKEGQRKLLKTVGITSVAGAVTTLLTLISVALLIIQSGAV